MLIHQLLALFQCWCLDQQDGEAVRVTGVLVWETARGELRFDAQSVETDVAKRKKLVWEIDKKLQEDVARPILYHARQGTCWAPYVKHVTVMRNSSYNGFRYEDVWMDK